MSVIDKIKDHYKLKLNVMRLNRRAVLPTRGSVGSAGLDIYSTEDYEIKPHSCCMVHTYLAMEIPEGYCGLLATRSSMGMMGVRIAAGLNIIDSDYRGELKVYLWNDGEYPWTICQGDRIAQLVIVPYYFCEVEETDELTKTKRGSGGLGSTGR